MRCSQPHCHCTQRRTIWALLRRVFKELHFTNLLSFNTNNQATVVKYFVAKESNENKTKRFCKKFSISGHQRKKTLYGQDSLDQELNKFGFKLLKWLSQTFFHTKCSNQFDQFDFRHLNPTTVIWRGREIRISSGLRNPSFPNNFQKGASSISRASFSKSIKTHISPTRLCLTVYYRWHENVIYFFSGHLLS